MSNTPSSDMSLDKLSRIRNFAIIAHIDHGKSTLADRMIEMCGGLEKREMSSQILDSMELEKEKGITIKAQTVKLSYNHNGVEYTYNLIDTPGHVDFTYEVNRSLAACEGSLLVVDASQGVEAQTIANVYQAIDNNHEIIPILNKVDLPAADVEKAKAQIEEIIGIDTSNALEISAKTGIGISSVLDAIATTLPPPQGDPSAPLKALLVDSWYDPYLGVIILVRIIDGVLSKGMKVSMMSTGMEYQAEQVGFHTPRRVEVEELRAGEVGFIIAGIKQVADCRVGDTITSTKKPCSSALAGFKPTQSVVFCGMYPSSSDEYNQLKDAIAKLHLNDASFTYEYESSGALGIGFRCGFLGLLHLEIICERLMREYGVDIITTAPSVNYNVNLTDGTSLSVHNPADLPDPVKIDSIEEPWIRATIMLPEAYLGRVFQLCTDKRGEKVEMQYLTETRVMLTYKLPLNEVVYDFYDDLKSYTQGYASLDWQMAEHRPASIVKVTILVNGEQVDSLSIMTHKGRAEQRGREICLKLKELIPKHLFAIPIQAAIGGKIIARETISALRKDVTSKCYGGDVSRKRKLLEKQKAGKKRMKMVGRVEIPQSAFVKALSSKKS